MRRLALTLVAVLVAAMPLLAQPTLAAAPGEQAADALPSPAVIENLMAPMTLTNFNVVAESQGWAAGESFQLTGGGPEVPVNVTIYASELPTPEGAAGFLQVQLQAYRAAIGAAGLNGSLGPAPEELKLDADEVYLGSFETSEGATPRILTVVLVARYETLVTAVDTSMIWELAGPIGDDSRRGLGAITGGLAALVDNEIE